MWSAALAIDMLSMGSKPMAHTSGNDPSSCISQDEPELDSKSTTNGATAESGTEAADGVAVGGCRFALKVYLQRLMRQASDVGSAMSSKCLGLQRRRGELLRRMPPKRCRGRVWLEESTSI